MKKAADSLLSLARLALHPRRATFGPEQRRGPLIILGNGPSLNDTLASEGDSLARHDLMAVNFAANTDVFFTLRPRYYVLADPHFFASADDPNVKALTGNLMRVDWDMTLFVPFGCTPAAANPRIKVEHYPMTAAEGWEALENVAFGSRMAMPRPRNVLIPSIMTGIWLGYNEIYLTGADHSWMKTLSVNERNEVVSIQPHFYKEDSREEERVRQTYMKVPLHSVVHSFYVAFRSYHSIDRWARSRGVAVYNSTPGSFIDAFERRPLP